MCALWCAHPASVLTAKVKSIGYGNPESRRKGSHEINDSVSFAGTRRIFRANLAYRRCARDRAAQNEPILVPDAVDYQKLLPILPEPPQGWTEIGRAHV